jgi:branched-chain amino acid transport system ATP-binding protein
MTNEVLRVEEIGQRFGGLQALHDVSFGVPVGATLGIIGPNGSGKTTLFEIVSGAQQPSTGRVYFNREDITSRAAHERCALGIGRTFQLVETLAQMSVFENVLVAAMLRHGGPSARRRALELLERLGLADRIYHEARELSASELRRLDLARALATDPSLLLLDEPLAGLTDEEIKRTFATLRELRDAGLTIIMIEHRMEPMFGFVSQVIALDAGEVIATGSPEDVRVNERVVASYLGTEVDAVA